MFVFTLGLESRSDAESLDGLRIRLLWGTLKMLFKAGEALGLGAAEGGGGP